MVDLEEVRKICGERAAAATIGYKNAYVGFSLGTGCRDYEDNRKDYVSKNYSMFGKNWWNHKWVNNSEINDYRLGAVYAGYKGYNFGWNSDNVRHTIQNKVAHTAIQPQPWIPRMTAPNTGIFMQHRTINPFTHW